MLYPLHEIHNVLEKRGQVDTVYLDFAKAFDKVSHDLLLVKLHNFGIRGHLLRWFGDYLSGQLQRVTVLGVTSDPQQDLDSVANWCNDWKMDLNQTKCVVMHFSRIAQPMITQYTISDTPILQSSSQKYLGITTTNDLKWNKQVQEKATKANKMLGFVKRTAFDNRQHRVRKVLYFGSQVWAPQTVNNILTVERVQRRATKFILSLPYQTDISYEGKIDHHRHHPYMLLARVFRSRVSLQVHHFQL
jgi:hypothetical protein